MTKVNAYHRIWLSSARLAIGKQAAVVALPSVIQDLLAKCFVYVILVWVIRVCFYHQTIFISSEAIMRPETVIESEWSLLRRCGVDDNSLVANHANTTLTALFSGIKGSYSYSDFDTHFNYN